MGRLNTAPGLSVVALVCVLVAGGCATNPAQPGPVPLGQPFTLPAASSTTLQSGLTVTFDRVTSDSRCPVDAQCVWAGDAVVVLTLSQKQSNRAERELHTERGRSEASYLTYTIELVALAPDRRSDRPIAPRDYVATLAVKAR